MSTPSRSKSHMGGGKPKEKSSSHAKPHEMHIKRAHGGGFIVKHHHKTDPMTGMTPDSEDHVVADPEQLQQHVADNMGDQPPAGTPMPQPQAPAPQAGPMPGM